MPALYHNEYPSPVQVLASAFCTTILTLPQGDAMLLQTILNRCYKRAAFDGGRIAVDIVPGRILAADAAHAGDANQRTTRPSWRGHLTSLTLDFFLSCMRRIDCAKCDVTTEHVPWADGKNQTCNAYRLFLARWARRVSWGEVARCFDTSWGIVYRCYRALYLRDNNSSFSRGTKTMH